MAKISTLQSAIPKERLTARGNFSSFENIVLVSKVDHRNSPNCAKTNLLQYFGRVNAGLPPYQHVLTFRGDPSRPQDLDKEG